MSYFEIDLVYDFNVSYIGQMKYEERWKHFERQIYNEYILYFVKDGEMFIEEDGVKYHLKKGEFIILEPNKKHKGYNFAPVKYYFIHIQGITFNKMNLDEFALADIVEKRRNYALSSGLSTTTYEDDKLCILPKTYQFVHYHEITYLLDRITYELNHKLENYKFYCVLLVKQLIILLNRQFIVEKGDLLKDRSYSNVKKLILYLEKNISNTLKTCDVERFINLNYDYMNRLFKAQTGYTIKSYYNYLKIEKAQQLIRQTNLPFCEIAEQIGIDDPFYFSKFYKAKTGLTPSQYKKELYVSIRE